MLESAVHANCRVDVTEDTKIPNAATIKIVKKDHTLGNMLRQFVLLTFFTLPPDSSFIYSCSALLANPSVLFAGYKVPHPLHPYFLLKIQTDGSQTPVEALETASEKLIDHVATLKAKFKREFEFAGAGVGGQGMGVGGMATGGDVGMGGVGGAYGEGSAWSGKDYLDL